MPFIQHIHWNHHWYISNHKTTWHWSNLFLFNDTWISTIDLWITEVVPTLLFAWVFDAWWVLVFYYVWASTVQEAVEHNTKINLYPVTSGQWHLLHHKQADRNFGVFIPVWDKLFGTEQWTSKH
jgi:sterol desaturase/sphingolipid hydroxylase (fatty acid hydroxylase superfamily)